MYIHVKLNFSITDLPIINGILFSETPLPDSKTEHITAAVAHIRTARAVRSAQMLRVRCAAVQLVPFVVALPQSLLHLRLQIRAELVMRAGHIEGARLVCGQHLRNHWRLGAYTVQRQADADGTEECYRDSGHSWLRDVIVVDRLQWLNLTDADGVRSNRIYSVRMWSKNAQWESPLWYSLLIYYMFINIGWRGFTEAIL